MAKRKNNRPNNYSINFWAMCERVLIGSMNKGQFPIACIFFIVVIWMFFVPGEKLYQLLPNLINMLKDAAFWGWLLSIFITLISFLSIKYLRRVHTREIMRLSEEKTILQEQLLKGKILKSSNF